jgi:hypothetical protein
LFSGEGGTTTNAKYDKIIESEFAAYQNE